MSFTDEINRELAETKLQKTCCRKAMLYGLFINASFDGEKRISLKLKDACAAEKAAEILKKQFSVQAEISEQSRAGRKTFCISFFSKAIFGFLEELDAKNEKTIEELLGFKCDACQNAFLRGVFVAAGSVSDPSKGYHLEFSVFSPERARKLCSFLEGIDFAPKTIERNGKVGIYYKKNITINDIIHYIGASKSSYKMTDIYIEKNLRSRANRATNFVTHNIEKTVVAYNRQREAIEFLEKIGRLEGLGADICYTARLHLENEGASLSELAAMHEPPISKSGLNRRLSKILNEATMRKKEQ